MSWSRRLRAAAAAFLLLAAPVAAPAQPTPDPTILAEAGADLPERIGDFTRFRISSVEPGRIGASYRNGTDALVDIFVSRAAVPLEEEFATTEGMIAHIFSELRRVRDLAPPPSAPSAKGRLWSGVSGVGPAYTAMMIDHRRGWRIKMRGTVSTAQGEAGIASLEKVMRDYGWWR